MCESVDNERSSPDTLNGDGTAISEPGMPGGSNTGVAGGLAELIRMANIQRERVHTNILRS